MERLRGEIVRQSFSCSWSATTRSVQTWMHPGTHNMNHWFRWFFCIQCIYLQQIQNSVSGSNLWRHFHCIFYIHWDTVRSVCAEQNFQPEGQGRVVDAEVYGVDLLFIHFIGGHLDLPLSVQFFLNFGTKSGKVGSYGHEIFWFFYRIILSIF